LNEFKDRGAYKVCACCGKAFYVIAPEQWVYKFKWHIRGEEKVKFMCSWHCLRAYEKEYQKKKDQIFREKNERIRQKHREKLRSIQKEYINRHCEECRYFSHGKYGFPDCSVIGRPIKGSAMACRRFKERAEVDEVSY